MAIGRSEDRDNPRKPLVLRHHVLVWDRIRVTHLGQRSSRPRHKGRTYDRNRPDPLQLPSPCEAGAVHIWFPGSQASPRPGMTSSVFLHPLFAGMTSADYAAIRCRASSRIMSAPFSAIMMVGA